MFSVIIPFFNASNTILDTLESCISQNYLPKQIILIDDFSSDDSLSVVKQWKEKYTGNIKIIIVELSENSGPSKARNRGWDLATGKYIAFLDSDDRFIPEKLEILFDTLKKKENILLLGHSYTTEEHELESYTDLKKISTLQLLKKNLSSTPSIIVKRDIKERFDTSMRYTEDHDLWLRITQRYDKTYYLDKILTIIGRPVRSKGGLSENLWAMRKGELKMYYKFCKINNNFLLLPILYMFSITKHGYNLIKDIYGKIK